MVKEVQITTDIPGSSVEDLWHNVFESAAAFQDYHATANADPNADVGLWKDGQRSISFCTPLQAPAIVKKTLGLESVRVREVSTVLKLADGSIRITSKPVLDFPGGSKFTTSAVTDIVPDGTRGCKVVTTARCAAAGPWGMQGRIEDIMASQATQTLEEFLRFCKQRCMAASEGLEPATPPLPAEHLSGALPQVEPVAALEAQIQHWDAAVPDSEAAAAPDTFYDAVTGVPFALERFQAEPGAEQNQAILDYLDRLCSAIQSTANESQLTRERLENLEHDVAELMRSRRLVLPVSTQQWPPTWLTVTILATTSITFASAFAFRLKSVSGS